MAPTGKEAKTEALWREAWVGCPYVGVIELGKDAAGQDALVVKCKTVFREHNKDAEVVDDGRTVGVGIGDTVSFGIVERKGKAPIAVNIYRALEKKKRKRRVIEAEDEGDDDLPPDLVGELPGILRNPSIKTGDYSVLCWKVYDAYQRDARILKDDLPAGIEVGDAIYFKVKPPAHEMAPPKASSIRKAPSSVGKEVMEKARERGAGKGFGKGFAKGGAEGGGKRPPIRRSGGATMRMVGIVKRPSETTGRYFIFCQDISDVYGKDGQIPDEEVPAGGLTPGDRIAFDVDEPDESRPNETPWAFNIKVIGSARGKKKAVAADLGDGEEEGDGEIEEKEEADEPEEKALGKEELEEAEAAEEFDAKLAHLAEEEDAARKPSRPAPKRRKALPPKEAAEDTSAPLEDPTTTEGWAANQERLFPGLSKLPKGWIRIRSKSRGLVYFYNVNSGQSTPHEPTK